MWLHFLPSEFPKSSVVSRGRHKTQHAEVKHKTKKVPWLVRLLFSSSIMASSPIHLIGLDPPLQSPGGLTDAVTVVQPAALLVPPLNPLHKNRQNMGKKLIQRLSPFLDVDSEVNRSDCGL